MSQMTCSQIFFAPHSATNFSNCSAEEIAFDDVINRKGVADFPNWADRSVVNISKSRNSPRYAVCDLGQKSKCELCVV